MLRVLTDALIHTDARPRCKDKTCPCQHGEQESVTIAPASFWPLKDGSPDCAWCADEMGIPPAQRTGSHGICQRHADMLVARAKMRKRGRS